MNDNNNLNVDDLFKRAAEDYPLRTDSANWDKVLGAMDKDDESFMALPYEQDGRRSRRRFLWLLLLLPIGGLGYYTWHAGHVAGHTSLQKNVVETHPGNPAVHSSDPSVQSPANSAAANPARNSAGVTNPGEQQKTAFGPAKSGGVKGGSGVGVKEGSGVNASAVNGSGKENREDKIAKQEDRPSQKQKAGKELATKELATLNAGTGLTTLNPRKNKSAGRGENFSDRQNSTSLETKAGQSAEAKAGPRGMGKTGRGKNSVRDKNTGRDNIYGDVESASGKETNAANSSYVHTARSLQLSPIAGIVPLTGIVSLNVKVSAGASGNSISKPAPAKPVAKAKNSSFYAGILVAPDLSTVKFQSVKGVGTTAGILFGYNINRKLALETGLYYDHKKYYSDGDNFSKKNLTIPSNYYLQNVDGGCDMWEIPLNLRYNFGKGDKIKWFATTGLSTYLMTKERYTYQYEDISTGWSRAYDWAGKNHSNYLFSVFNLSLGYEQSLGKIGNLRLEPYLRVPLAGFGKGSLPILSTGFNIGITRRIW